MLPCANSSGPSRLLALSLSRPIPRLIVSVMATSGIRRAPTVETRHFGPPARDGDSKFFLDCYLRLMRRVRSRRILALRGAVQGVWRFIRVVSALLLA